eukprot:TRINITY_DN1740_c0_g1_i1.p1 TRINITY_DN1740_c0_g1~~TRINITY_DN1740_c0_g1_i1.p1  ORF type:complete len:197 (+),score=-9.73 TRINITY_DN1740_c0_g1_i1:516-1106(+)
MINLLQITRSKDLHQVQNNVEIQTKIFKYTLISRLRLTINAQLTFNTKKKQSIILYCYLYAILIDYDQIYQQIWINKGKFDSYQYGNITIRKHSQAQNIYHTNKQQGNKWNLRFVNMVLRLSIITHKFQTSVTVTHNKVTSIQLQLINFLQGTYQNVIYASKISLFILMSFCLPYLSAQAPLQYHQNYQNLQFSKF